jgi:hypothetical protein
MVGSMCCWWNIGQGFSALTPAGRFTNHVCNLIVTTEHAKLGDLKNHNTFVIVGLDAKDPSTKHLLVMKYGMVYPRTIEHVRQQTQ